MYVELWANYCKNRCIRFINRFIHYRLHVPDYARGHAMSRQPVKLTEQTVPGTTCLHYIYLRMKGQTTGSNLFVNIILRFTIIAVYSIATITTTTTTATKI